MLENDFLDVKKLAKRSKSILPQSVSHFINGGAGLEKALSRNKKSFDKINLSPRVLRGLKNVNTELKLFNYKQSTPLLLAPAAYQALLSHGGELDMADAINRINATMIVSLFSSKPHKEIAQKINGPLWLQLYLLKDKAINQTILEKATEWGVKALVLTVDAPVYATRYKEKTTPLTFPKHIDFSHLEELGIPVSASLKSKMHLSQLLDSSLSWDDISWLAENSNLPIILKGVMDPRDSKIALEFPNIKGIVVSNHGGRQLDCALSPIEVIEKHRQQVGNKLKLFLDGAIDCGSDVFKSIALGADAVLIGRAALWALALGGSDNVYKLLNQITNELKETMTLCGCNNLEEISSDFIIKGEKNA